MQPHRTTHVTLQCGRTDECDDVPANNNFPIAGTDGRVAEVSKARQVSSSLDLRTFKKLRLADSLMLGAMLYVKPIFASQSADVKPRLPHPLDLVKIS